ncbi:hypothetical protein BN341_3670 [Helicobacter heilmannii ASB1.4]|nr:hypothetical protein BN341_3300 [Helicobacter heilmannii ASB1.4]CCM73363.1 hypothetical protein BN341_3670 [Helicobacter heilmannii ASB1.4]
MCHTLGIFRECLKHPNPPQIGIWCSCNLNHFLLMWHLASVFALGGKPPNPQESSRSKKINLTLAV